MNAVLDIEILDDRIIERSGDLSFSEQVAFIGRTLARCPQTDCPVIHRFAPGVYLREIHMPADTVVIGKVHRTEHFNVLIKGSCFIVHDDGRREELRAPMTFVSKAGVQKVLYILEDMIWQTIHPTDETDMEKLEADIVEPCEWAVPNAVTAECRRIAEERA
jgi:hypothetical protein